MTQRLQIPFEVEARRAQMFPTLPAVVVARVRRAVPSVWTARR